MSPKNRAIARGAVIADLLRRLEVEIQAGMDDAQSEGLGDVAGAMDTLKTKVIAAHAKAEIVAGLLGLEYQESPATFSGGNDKPL
jgi:hypothetical protein